MVTTGLKIEAPHGEKKLLLHACCAPCSSAIVEVLLENGITPTLFFSNSNITPFGEYDIRKRECERYAAHCGIQMVEDEYDHELWLGIAEGLEDAPERGPRCLECFRFRLTRAARYASEHGFALLATTLASSRWKSLQQVNAAGIAACEAVGNKVSWWEYNWRKGGLQQRRSEIIKEQNFYNQLFCGCEFSPRPAKEPTNP